MKRVLVGCEKSGRVRDAFTKKGWDAWSCDIRPSDAGGQHITGDLLEQLDLGWDLLIAHPPCTYLCTAGARWLYDPRFPDRMEQRRMAVDFVLRLWCAPIPQIGIENPIGHLSTAWKQPDQVIQPWWFGEDASKATCLWLKNLPLLRPTKVVEPSTVTTKSGRKWNAWFFNNSRGRSTERSDARSLTFQGIADAMADQWSRPCPIQLELSGLGSAVLI